MDLAHITIKKRANFNVLYIMHSYYKSLHICSDTPDTLTVTHVKYVLFKTLFVDAVAVLHVDKALSA